MLHNTRSGVSRIEPMASPSHHVNQAEAKSLDWMKLPMDRLVTPIVALTTVLSVAARRANFKISWARSKALRPLANRLRKRAPTNPSSVLPVAMPSDVATEPAVVTFAKKAPRKIAGQTREPSNTKAASAMPVPGHTELALGYTNASFSPSLAATK